MKRTTMKAEEFHSDKRIINGTSVTVTSYRLGEAWHCTVANVDPGANIARADGATREEAVSAAVAKAESRLK